jgi:hypothetical protein
MANKRALPGSPPNSNNMKKANAKKKRKLAILTERQKNERMYREALKISKVSHS